MILIFVHGTIYRSPESHSSSPTLRQAIMSPEFQQAKTMGTKRCDQIEGWLVWGWDGLVCMVDRDKSLLIVIVPFALLLIDWSFNRIGRRWLAGWPQLPPVSEPFLGRCGFRSLSANCWVKGVQPWSYLILIGSNKNDLCYNAIFSHEKNTGWFWLHWLHSIFFYLVQ